MKRKNYYTSTVTLRQTIALLFISGINIFFLEAVPHNVFTIGLLTGFHSWFFGRVAAYMAGGVFSTAITKLIYTLVFLLLFFPLVFLSVTVELAVTGACALVLAAVFSFWVYSPGRMNGDNSSYSEDEIDERWFDTVDGLAYKVRVSFPLDIGCYKNDRLEGNIEALGLASAGKYEGEEVALVTALGRRYVCPIRHLKPAELKGGDRGVVIACNSSKEVKFISWKNGEKATGVFYVLGIKPAWNQ
jgi:hypothetical protein